MPKITASLPHTVANSALTMCSLIGVIGVRFEDVTGTECTGAARSLVGDLRIAIKRNSASYTAAMTLIVF